jgi:hypothetical protein
MAESSTSIGKTQQQEPRAATQIETMRQNPTAVSTTKNHQQ